MIKTAHLNILETAAVTLSAGTEDASCPLYRLFDRNIGRMFRPTAAETIEIKVDQGASGAQAVDRLLIPSGHNLSGMALGLMCSDDDIAYTEAVPQWTGEAGVIDKTWAELTKRYWKFMVTAPASIPEMPEMFLTGTYAWPLDPQRPYGPFEDAPNVENAVTASGHDRWLVFGDPRRRRPYGGRCGEAQKDALLALWATHMEGKPFWLYDHAGAWIWGKLDGGLDLRERAWRAYSYSFPFMEVLP